MPNTPATTAADKLPARTARTRTEDLSGRLDLPDMPGNEADIAERFAPGQWKFTAEVAGSFDEHVRASVPYYDDIQALIAECADWLLPEGGLLADLGCSTGNTAAAVLTRHSDRGLRVALYDSSTAMLAKARPAVEDLAPGRVDSHVHRLQTGRLHHSGADLTVCAFVLQFLSHADRITVLSEALRASSPTGALLVAEKTRPVDSRWAEIANEVSQDVKAGNGISGEAIRAKARALRGVLVPYTLDTTVDLITHAGWRSPEVIFRWHSWALIGAFATW